MEKVLLNMKAISKTFGSVQALKEVSLDLYAGEVLALMGENGAGKSTLMKCLIGIHPPTSGKIVFDGKEIRFKTTLEALNSGISMIHQELANVPDRSVQENIWLGREPVLHFGPFRALRHRKMHDDTVALMKELEMDIRPDVRMGQLSISHQQVCEIAKAVSCDAAVVVMDEPTFGQDFTTWTSMVQLIAGARDQGCAVIMITHDEPLIEALGARRILVREGE